VRVSLRLDSAGRRTVRALGSVRGGRTELISLTAFHAPAGKRFRRVGTRTAVVRGGAFRTRLSRYKRGRWRVQATLRGSASVVGAQRRRLSDDDDSGPDRILEDQRRSAEDGDEPQPDPATLVESRVSFGEGVTPGPLPGGGYVSQGDEDQGDGTLERIDAALESAGFEPASGTEYTAADAAAVRRFQRAHGLLVDGVVGRQTLAALQQYAG